MTASSNHLLGAKGRNQPRMVEILFAEFQGEVVLGTQARGLANTGGVLAARQAIWI
jgi:hypothetical protein